MAPSRSVDDLASARAAVVELELELSEERERSQRYLDVAGSMIVALDPNGRIAAVNRMGCGVLGYTEEELVGRDFMTAVIAEPYRHAARELLAEMASGTAAGDAADYEADVLTSAGDQRTIAWHVTALRDAAGRLIGTLASGEDITRRRRTEAQITYLAYHDALTGLPNRTLLEEHLKLALARARRTGASVALLHLDLDSFKLVNDSLGHAGGDRLMCGLAIRLQEATRTTDLLARPGGDEMLLLVADIHEDAVAVAVRAAQGIADSLQDPFSVGGAEFQVSGSIGISIYPRDARDAGELLSHADTAMYRAKAVARGGWAIFDEGARDPLERLSLTTKLRRALASEEFLLHYQPIFGLPQGELVAVEALLRWHDPDRGMVPPGDFIPLAEETGLIEAIGDWVVGAVCDQQVAWARKGFTPQISFNVSPRQLRRLDFTSRVAEHLRRSGADPSHLTVEVTESATMQDAASAEPILRALHGLGLGIALDDFGSGYSSLSRLREMPVETLKIDRAFLREVPENREAAAMVTAILRLSRALGRTAVAEGVETEEQREFLVGQGCPLVQGFLLGRPMAPEALPALMPPSADAAP